VLRASERLVVTGLTSGTTYYTVFVLVFPDGTEGETSAEQSSSAGFVLSTNIGTGEITADLVSFNAAAIGGIQQFVGTATPTTTAAEGSTWINTSNGSYYTLTSGSWVQRQWDSAAIAANAISTTQLAAGAITADSAIIANGAIGSAQIATAAITDAKIQSLDAAKITTGTISAARLDLSGVLTATDVGSGGSTVIDGGRITSGTITGRTIQSRASGLRVLMTDTDAVRWLNSTTAHGDMRAVVYNNWTGSSVNGVLLENPGNLNVENDITCNTLHGTSFGIRFSALGSDTGLSGVIINASGTLRKDSSTQAIKYDMAALSGVLSDSVDADRQLGVATVDTDNVLDLAVTEFSVIDDDEPTDRRVLGFIADDVADKLPIAALYEEDGTPSCVLDTAILASLLAVVKEQQQTIADLTARIEALEA
ncbi:MAG TPA: hypothetical protein VIG24_01515, partial [Acidimicrobiia bacterium]